jgi:cytochrome c5
MAETPRGTPVGVADPYEHAGRCDFLTDDGRCRYAAEHAGHDPDFAAARRDDDLRCPAADPEGDWEWSDCPHFRSTTTGDECARCGLEERRDAHSEARPLVEEHHLSYADGASAADAGPSHEITVALCRWCHAKVHGSFARVGDDANPDPAALAAAQGRRSDELAEAAFETAAERREE